MKIEQRPAFEQRIQRPLRRAGGRAALGLLGLALAAACARAPINEEPRYPEKRRPPALRSASDGEVMGANGQAPEDTLEGSPTNLHPAPGWEGEKGAMERAREADCDPEVPKAKNASTADPTANADANAATAKSGRSRSGKPCPKPAAR